MKTYVRMCISLLLLSPFIMSACSDDDDDEYMGKWYRMSDFDGLARRGASSFTIGNKGYIVGGYDGKNALSDLWEYDIDRDTWTQKATFPGEARHSGVGLSVDNKGYYGTGYMNSTYYNDFWEFDPSGNTWSQKTSFPASGRYAAIAFGLSGKGYIGAGYDGNYLKDFYSFNPTSDSWEQIVSIGGSKRRGATSFVIDGIAYVCCGENNGSYVSDFWKFDPQSGSWTQLRDIYDSSDDDYDDDYTDIVRKNSVAFVIDGVGYMACGEQGGLLTSVWKYYPTKDLWEEVRKFKGSARTETVSFSTGQRGFVVTGRSGTTYFDDIWELKPFEYDDDEY